MSGSHHGGVGAEGFHTVPSGAASSARPGLRHRRCEVSSLCSRRNRCARKKGGDRALEARDVKEFFEKVAADWDTMRLAYYDERVIEKMVEASGSRRA
jgi:hypothetical protein